MMLCCFIVSDCCGVPTEWIISEFSIRLTINWCGGYTASLDSQSLVTLYLLERCGSLRSRSGGNEGLTEFEATLASVIAGDVSSGW